MCMDEMTGRIFLCDFGFARKFQSLTARGFNKNHYAPELRKNKSIKAHPSQDVYTLGYLLSHYENLNEELKEIVSLMMDPIPTARPSVLVVIKRCEHILSEISPKRSLSSSEIKDELGTKSKVSMKRNLSHHQFFKVLPESSESNATTKEITELNNDEKDFTI